jgi:hypothetical protein
MLNWLFPERRPSPELHERFKQISRERYGDELAELWDDESIEDSGIRRCHFTGLMYLGDPGRIPLVC